MFKSLDDAQRDLGGDREVRWRRFPLPLKLFIVFWLISYSAQFYFAYEPRRISFALAYSMCPLCILGPTADPTISDLVYFLGPVDATLYGLMGALIG